MIDNIKTAGLLIAILTVGVLAIHGLIWVGVRSLGLMFNHPLEALVVSLIGTILLFVLPSRSKVGQ